MSRGTKYKVGGEVGQDMTESNAFVLLSQTHEVLLYTPSAMEFDAMDTDSADLALSGMRAKAELTRVVSNKSGYGGWSFTTDGYLEIMMPRYEVPGANFVPKFVFGDFLAHDAGIIITVRTGYNWKIGATDDVDAFAGGPITNNIPLTPRVRTRMPFE